MTKLPRRQERFCREFIVDFDCQGAAARAGYKRQAAGLLENAAVRERIAQLLWSSVGEQEFGVNEILDELRHIAFSDISEVVQVVQGSCDGRDGATLNFSDFSALPGEVLAAVASVKMGTRGVEVRMYDKLRALYYLGLCHGLWDKKTGDTAQEVRIIDDIAT